MAISRGEIVDESASGTYHCISRCVRRAFLYGTDPETGRDLTRRKDWIVAKLRGLSRVFSVDVFAYAVMSDHMHVVLRTHVEAAAAWSDREVASRWQQVLQLSRKEGEEQGKAFRPAPGEAGDHDADHEQVKAWRSRLSSVSWFMRRLNEDIARTANREDGCRGRFWEGRFKCQRVVGGGALFACMAYVDLNPVRVGAVKTLRACVNTSVRDRLAERRANAGRTASGGKGRATTAWLADTRDPAMDVAPEEYLRVLEWTARRLAAGKPGRVPGTVKSILASLQLDPGNWLDTVASYGSLFWRVAGRSEAIAAVAGRADRRWLKGVKSSRQAFLKPPQP